MFQRRTTLFITFGLLFAILLASSSVFAADPPTYGSATVDGDISEWDLTDDFFAEMRRGGQAQQDITGQLYLRYECSTNTMYALVLLNDDYTITSPTTDEQFVKINDIKVVDETNDNGGTPTGTPPEFAYVPSGSSPKVGWEASFQLSPPPSGSTDYSIQAHALFDDPDEAPDDPQTSSTVTNPQLEVTIDCDPLAVTVGYVHAARNGTVTEFRWQTATENGTAGFNVLVEEDVELIQLNEELIPSKVIDSVVPTNYSFSAVTDASVYYLEEISIDGKVSSFGPYEVGVEYGSYSAVNDVVPSVYLPLMQR